MKLVKDLNNPEKDALLILQKKISFLMLLEI